VEKNAKNPENRKIIKVKIPKKPKSSLALFSQKDVKRFVSEFITSWIRGDITIRFPTAAELAKKTPFAIAFPTDPSVDAELKIKEYYIDLLSICSGTKPATEEEQEKAITDTFKMLLMFRSANRIEGKILSNDLERRIEELEKTAKSTSNLIDQITRHLFQPKKPKAAKKGSKNKAK
jgi:hypothetical protein